MQQKPYQEFVSLGKQKQLNFILEQKQEEECPIPLTNEKYPELDFIPLEGIQDKKAIKLATYRFPAEDAKAVVVFLHTVGNHIGVSAHLAQFLAKHGFTTVGFDLRGHGRSEGERCYVDNWREVLKDATNFLQAVKKIEDGKPIFLIGHGFGGLMSIFLSKEKKVKLAGMILIAPALKKPESGKIYGVLADIALKLIPSRKGLIQINYINVTRNPKVTEYLNQDPLMLHQKILCGSVCEMIDMMESNDQKIWNTLTTPPIAIIQGQMDKVAYPMNSINLYERIKTQDKEFWWYPKMWNHVLLQNNIQKLNKESYLGFKKGGDMISSNDFLVGFFYKQKSILLF